MHRQILTIAAMFIAGIAGVARAETHAPAAPAGGTLHAWKMRDIDGKEVSLDRYKGKVVLVVNVASKCGLTPQYEALQKLHDKYGPAGFAIAGFPANNFRGQEPGDEAQIKAFCQSKYNVKFDLYAKLSVKGDDQHPLYQWITAGAGRDDLKGEITWNFEKFLFGVDGKPLARFAPKTKPDDAKLVAAIEQGLKAVTAPAAPEPLPPAVKVYHGRKVAHTMHWLGADWLTRTEREREEGTALMISKLGIKPGMTVADIGCGNGYHTLMLAKLVGEAGRVIGNDIQKEMLDLLSQRAKQASITNVTPILGTLIDTRLPEASCDLVLLSDAYHEFSHPVHMLASIRKAMKPAARIALVEFRAEDDRVPIKPDHKMSKAQILKEFQANGFKLADQFDGLPWQHLMFFERDEAWKP